MNSTLSPNFGVDKAQLDRRRRGSDVVDGKLALDLATHTYDENVYLFVPNLIGYTRVILVGISLHYMGSHPNTCTLLYGISALLDAVDGQAARALGQTSKFGAVLDMVTDRCATSCLLCYLSSRYTSYAAIFQMLITLDFSSHYMHMYSSLVTGSKSHKAVSSDVSRILWYYYNDSTTLFVFCAANELFFVALYLISFGPYKPVGGPFTTIADLLLTFQPSGAPIPALDSAAKFIANLSLPDLLALISFPISFAKNVINVVQLWKASKMLVGVDLADRAKEREARHGTKQE
ncbi:CDP-diacylglycerol-inositol 3-phosphatidyltransferase [Rhizoctonia solani AG-3 Rhs1AP]|uniref:CDP-diacylglycerol-inositol 3-phosphatidyltransferase n=2 Tax=Rhizoctonia solani AG-3 TaxID=1086053 RepID=A0A074S7B2_9AGAM|nr:CDP-diacylglycerol-inositol 3-phosphatidyltransferase [Rhizoctonia solani AG-3 Rhs1AP]KEP55281.1 CDP-diacylglycerol-inositol 3-phosphatidyltransferase [Rhizoctonia solani 123E]